MNNYLTSPTHAVVDTTGPVFSSISFDRGTAYVGDIVTVSVIANDPESGIDYCYAGLYGSTDEYLTGIYMTYNSIANVCTGTFQVNQYWSSFGYFDYVEVGNNANNYSYFYDGIDYNSPIINFPNTTPDNTGPLFQTISFDRGSANVGDNVYLNIFANDPESGVQYCYANLRDQSNNYLTDIYLNYNSSTGVCTGNFEVDQYWSSSGHINYVEIGNNANNYTYFYDGVDFTSPVLNFVDTTPDSTGALFTNVYFLSSYLYVGETLIINASVNDPESGIDYCYANIYGPTGYVEGIYMSYNNNSGQCSGRTEVSQFWPSSVYVYSLEVRNNANNYTYFYDGVDFLSSSVPIDYTDIFAPEIYSVFDYTYEFEGDNWITIESNEAGFGTVYLDDVEIAGLTFASPGHFWFNATNFAHGEHSLSIWVSDYSSNAAWYYYTISVRNSQTIIETFTYTYDYNSDGVDDQFALESKIEFTSLDLTYVEAILTVEKYDPNTSEYNYYNQFTEGRDFYGDGVDWFYHYFDVNEQGDYKFTIQYYVNSQYMEAYTQEYFLFLGSQYNSEFKWDLSADESDRDNNGQADHIKFVLHINFENLQPSNIEINVQVVHKNQKDSVYSYNFHLEGSGDHESVFEFRADDNTEYYFLFDIFVNGEHRESGDFTWDGHRFDPDNHSTISEPTSISDSESESSAAPGLPVPAGDAYLFIIALLSSTILLRRKQN